jgi:hypothetical protein
MDSESGRQWAERGVPFGLDRAPHLQQPEQVQVVYFLSLQGAPAAVRLFSLRLYVAWKTR